MNGKSVKYQLASGPQVSQKCSHCGSRHVCAGPIWAEPIHDQSFVSLLKKSLIEKDDLKTYRRLFGILTMIEEELPDIPLFHVTSSLSSIVSTGSPSIVDFRSALLNAGYRVSGSHACKSSIKTDAPPDFIWDIMRAWEKLNPANKDKMQSQKNLPGLTILETESKHEISFELHPEADTESKRKILRFQINPEKYWGPKQRSKTSLFTDEQEQKKIRKQGKRRRYSNDTTNNKKNKDGE